MLRTIIPSKDRAAQLDLLLRSMKRFVTELADNTTMISWVASSDEFRSGYERVRAEHPEFVFVERDEFRADFKKMALSGEEGYLQILVDDDVFVAPFSVNDKEFLDFAGDEAISALSLRMSPGTTYCYTENVSTGQPWFRSDRAWCWPGRRGDWGYPHSIDGSIWRRRDVRGIISGGNYALVHELEPALRYGMTRPLALCYASPRVRGVAANTVQDDVGANRHGGGDAAEINRRYLDGGRLLMDNIVAASPNSPHFEIELEWT